MANFGQSSQFLPLYNMLSGSAPVAASTFSPSTVAGVTGSSAPSSGASGTSTAALLQSLFGGLSSTAAPAATGTASAAPVATGTASALPNQTLAEAGSDLGLAGKANSLYNLAANATGNSADTTTALTGGGSTLALTGAGDVLGILNAVENPDNPGADAAAAVDAYGLGSAGAALASGAGVAGASAALSAAAPYAIPAVIAADVLANNVNLGGIHPGSGSVQGFSAADAQALGLTTGTLNGQGDISTNGVAYEYGNQTQSGSDSFHVYDPTTGTYGASIGIPQSNAIVNDAKTAAAYQDFANTPGASTTQILTPEAQALQNESPDWAEQPNAAAASQTESENDYYGGFLTSSLAALNDYYGSAAQWGGLSESAWDQSVMNLSNDIALPAASP